MGSFHLCLGYGFDIKEFMEPLEIIKLCVKKREPELAVRYVHLMFLL